MREQVFERRLRALARGRFSVLPLAEALDRLDRGTLPPASVVLTFDDGFYSNIVQAVPLLRRFGFPATIYVTTYYAEVENPVFRLVVQYMMWKTTKRSLDLSALPGHGDDAVIDLHDRERAHQAIWRLIQHAEVNLSESERASLCEELGCRLDVPYEVLVRDRPLSLMRLDELRTLAACGVTVEMHTHRHRSPSEEGAFMREIDDNRAVLEPVTGAPLRHFCYPSGVWMPAQLPWLAVMNVVSAVTTDPGLNVSEGDRLALRRFLDDDRISDVEFEAEIYGFAELLRRIRSLIRWRNNI